MDAATLDLVGDPAVVLDAAGCVTGRNAAAGRLMRLTAADVGQPFDRFIASEDRAAWSEVIAMAVRGDELTLPLRMDVLAATGETIPAEITIGRPSAGTTPVMIAVIRDVTDRQQQEAHVQRMLSDIDEHRARIEVQAEQSIAQAEALHVSEQRLALILASTHDAYWDWNIDTDIVDFNPHFAEALGLGVVTSESLAAFVCRVHRDERAAVAACFAAARHGDRETIAPGEFRLLHGNGRSLWVVAKGQVVNRTGSGRPRRAVGMLSNVNDRRVRDEEDQRLRRLETVGGLASGVAHEINTPLQLVGDNLTFLAGNLAHFGAPIDGERPDDRPRCSRCGFPAGESAGDESGDLAYLRAEFPRAIRESIEGVERVSRIVRALKEFAHPGQTERDAVDLRRVIENAVTLTRGEWRHAAHVETVFDDLPTIVTGSQSDCTQLVTNLIVNAAQALAGQRRASLGRILVRADAAGDECLIVVSDDGPGMSAEVIAHAFEPFFTTKPVGQGTGQGLTLARAIVQRHGGTITVESQPGRGAVFAVRLPSRDASSTAV